MRLNKVGNLHSNCAVEEAVNSINHPPTPQPLHTDTHIQTETQTQLPLLTFTYELIHIYILMCLQLF